MPNPWEYEYETEPVSGPWEHDYQEPSESDTQEILSRPAIPAWPMTFGQQGSSDTATLDRRQLALASRENPMPGYTTEEADTLKTMAEARDGSQPSDLALAAGRFQNERALEAPPEDFIQKTLGGFAPFTPLAAPVEPGPPSTYDRFKELNRQSWREAGSGLAEESYKAGRAMSGAPAVEDEAPDDALKIAKGAGRAGGDLIASFTELENLPLLMAGALPGALGKAATALFMADMVSHAPEIYQQVSEALRSGDKEKEAEALVNALAQGAFFTAMGLHLKARSPRESVQQFMERYTPEQRAAFYERLKPEWSKQLREKALPEGESNASSEQKTAAVHETVREPAAESAAEVSTPDRDQGIQPPAEQGVQAPQEKLPDLQRDDVSGLLDKVGGMSPEEFREWSGKLHQGKGRERTTKELAEAALEGDFVDDLKAKYEEINQRWRDEVAKAQKEEDPQKKLEHLERAGVISDQGQFFNEAYNFARADPVTQQERMDRKWNRPLSAFTGEIPANKPHFPVLIENASGHRYEAYMAGYVDYSELGMGVKTQIGKVRPGKSEADLGLSHGFLGKNEKIVAGDYPKTPEEYKAAVESGVKPPRTLAPEAGKEIQLTPVIRSGEVMFPGKNHADALEKATASGDTELITKALTGEKGFQDQHGKFYTRQEAAEIYKRQGGDPRKMIKPEEGLHSEDLKHLPKKAEVKVSAAETERAPAYALGIAAPGTAQAQQLIGAFRGAVKEGPKWARDVWNSFSLKSAPKMTRSKREVGEAAVRYAASPLVGRTKGQIFADRVLKGTKVDPVKFGTALTEDNLRNVRQNLQNELAEISDPEIPEKVDPVKGAQLQEQLAKSATLIGTEGSPFRTEAEYQAFLADPQTITALRRHRQMWIEQKDPLFRQATDLDPDTPLQTRGLQTGARINLKAINPEEPGVAPIGRQPGFRQLATLRRRDPFAAKATGAGQAYEGHYHEIMAHGFERELPVAAQHQFIKELIENGDATVRDKSFIEDLELNGENTKGYLLTLKPWTGKFLHVREGLVPEYEGISNLRQPIKVPILSAANDFLTRQSIAGLAEGTTHASNLMTTVFTAPGPTANPLLNTLIKSLGRVDLLYSIPKIIIKGFSNQRERMLELAEIGAAKEPYTGVVSRRILNPIDQGVRLVLDDIYQGMAKKGMVEKSETARREFINQVGQYNKRLQPNLTRILRETLNPFQTATQTFVAQGLRRMALGPGVKASNNARALALKADVAAGWIGGVALVTTLNLILSGKASGPAGTPLGAVGWVDEKGKVRSFNVFRLLGYERGLRATGVGPAVEARMRGLSGQASAQAGAQSVVSTGLGMVMGPGLRFGTVAGTGLRPTQPWVKEARTVPPSDSFNPIKTQMAENIKTALVEANPILSTAAEIRKGVKGGQKPTDIALKALEKQASRYAPRSGMTEKTAKALPKIVDSRQLRDYTEEVARDARKLPLNQRYNFVRKRFNEDELGRKYRDPAWSQIERKGVLKYQ